MSELFHYDPYKTVHKTEARDYWTRAVHEYRHNVENLLCLPGEGLVDFEIANTANIPSSKIWGCEHDNAVYKKIIDLRKQQLESELPSNLLLYKLHSGNLINASLSDALKYHIPKHIKFNLGFPDYCGHWYHEPYEVTSRLFEERFLDKTLFFITVQMGGMAPPQVRDFQPWLITKMTHGWAHNMMSIAYSISQIAARFGFALEPIPAKGVYPPKGAQPGCACMIQLGWKCHLVGVMQALATVKPFAPVPEVWYHEDSILFSKHKFQTRNRLEALYGATSFCAM